MKPKDETRITATETRFVKGTAKFYRMDYKRNAKKTRNTIYIEISKYRNK